MGILDVVGDFHVLAAVLVESLLVLVAALSNCLLRGGIHCDDIVERDVNRKSWMEEQPRQTKIRRYD